jgi:hypothetical protein
MTIFILLFVKLLFKNNVTLIENFFHFLFKLYLLFIKLCCKLTTDHLKKTKTILHFFRF